MAQRDYSPLSRIQKSGRFGLYCRCLYENEYNLSNLQICLCHKYENSLRIAMCNAFLKVPHLVIINHCYSFLRIIAEKSNRHHVSKVLGLLFKQRPGQSFIPE